MLFVALFALAQVPALAQDEAIEPVTTEDALSGDQNGEASPEGSAPTGEAALTPTPADPSADKINDAAELAVVVATKELQPEETSAFDAFDAAVGKHIVGPMAKVLFWDAFFWDNSSEDNKQMPIVVLWLVCGAVFFTLRMGFINLRGFKHAIKVTKGDYDDPNDPGEISHFQALTSALSATVGLGNIAGVAIAVAVGGPGAVFWMVMAGFLGMSSKFVECTLGQKFRKTRDDGRVMGGAMYYLSEGLAEKGMGKLGAVLAVMFAVLCIGGSFGGGNAFQVNQSLNALQETVPWFADYRWVYGLIMTGLVGIVILGGIKRIATTAEKIVPAMCGLYVLACLYIMGSMIGDVPAAVGTIVSTAFSPEAGFGGLIGVLVQGFRRAAFSNEAGVGSAAIAHSAAKTDHPVREGVVALLEPFIDTILVCSMTGIVIVLTGAYQAEVGGVATEFAPYLSDSNGAGLTSQAFGSVVPWFPYVLSMAVVLFAFSTMISWSYYGERCWAYLFGDGSSNVYKVLFLCMTFLGSVLTSTNILDMSDLMILGMAFPNILGLYILSGDVRSDLDDYWAKLKAGEFKEHRG